MLRFSTAGESHGEALVAQVSGLPAGVPVDQAFLNRELWRRQQGYGRGGRMRIEQDRAHILSGVRHGKTIGSPIAMTLANNDWKNWEEILPVESGDQEKHKAVKSPRPGHADLAGSLKYDFPDARYVLERASARESAARVACGALAKLLLRELGVEVGSHVIRVGGAELGRDATWSEIAAANARPEVFLNCVDSEAEARMKAEVDTALRTGDTIGGVFEVVVHGLPPGVGTHVNWDERMDGLLAQAVMSLQAVKAVELGRGVTAAAALGSTVHDAIGYTREIDSEEPEDGGSKLAQDPKFTRFTREIQQRRRHRGRHLERRGHRRPRLPEAHLHAPPPARQRLVRKPRDRQGRLRALRRLRRSSRRRSRRGHGRAHHRPPHDRQVRRRLPQRDAPQLHRLRPNRSADSNWL